MLLELQILFTPGKSETLVVIDGYRPDVTLFGSGSEEFHFWTNDVDKMAVLCLWRPHFLNLVSYLRSKVCFSGEYKSSVLHCPNLQSDQRQRHVHNHRASDKPK